jgi:hypothetical protein
MGETILLVALFAAGAVGGIFSARLPMSGKAALGLSLVPLAIMWVTSLFC